MNEDISYGVQITTDDERETKYVCITTNKELADSWIGYVDPNNKSIYYYCTYIWKNGKIYGNYRDSSGQVYIWDSMDSK